MIFKEGYFIETIENLIFEVKGILHPKDRVIAFLRYVPDKEGDREKNGLKYRKIYSLKERFNYLSKHYPKYIYFDHHFNRLVQSVRRDEIKEIYEPEDKLKILLGERKLDCLQETALKLAMKLVEESKIDLNCIGITGSILVDLHREDSDIDIVVYGFKEGRSVFEELKKMRSNNMVKPLTYKEAEKVSIHRWMETKLPIDAFIPIERKKILHGTYNGREYFIRLVLNPSDLNLSYERVIYKPLAEEVVEGVIKDDYYSIYTPNVYEVEECFDSSGNKIKSLFSLRGKFTEQVSKGKRFRARGRVEEVIVDGKHSHYQLTLGESSDYLLPV